MKSQLYLLYFAAFITIAGFGMVFPLLPFYAQKFGASPAQLGLLAASFSITQFLFAPIVGRLSDKYGRKPILVAALAGASLSYFLFAMAHSLPLLFVARAVQGLASAGVFPIASAYIGDSTTKEDRVKYMSRLTAMFSLGFIVGPGVTGILADANITLPFLIASGLAALNCAFIFFFLPESLTKKQVNLVIKEGFINVKAIYNTLRGEFSSLFLLLFAWSFAIANFDIAYPLFAEAHFGFTASQIGFVFMGTGALATVNQLLILPRMVKWVGEHNAVAIGIFVMALGQSLIPFAPGVGLMLLFTGFSSFGGSLARPTINAILSKITREGQGSTMGLAFSFESLGRVAGPLIAGVLIGTLGLPSQFVLTGIILAATLLFFIKYIRSDKQG